MKFNPFKPNSIVSPGMFAGRATELMNLEKGFFQTKNGNPWHFLIHGERGIGKSSLMLIADYIAQGAMPGIEGSKSNFLTVTIEITPNMQLIDVLSGIENEIKHAVQEFQQTKEAFKKVWEFVSAWEVCGVKYTGKKVGAAEMVPELTRMCTTVCKQLEGTIDGIYIFIDEADNASDETKLGEFVKMFTERLTRSDCNNVALGLSGISAVYETLKESHESSVRILNSLKLETLEDEERKTVIRMGLKQANETAETAITIKPDAEEWIARFSEGFPHFIQQYAFSSFDTDTDNCIEIQDVLDGAYKENGALDQLGERYFNDMYNARINSDEYRKVLNSMADHPEIYISRKEIMQSTGLKKTTLDNALRSLKEKEIIIPSAKKAGLYKLPNDSFGAWIRAQAKKESDETSKSF